MTDLHDPAGRPARRPPTGAAEEPAQPGPPASHADSAITGSPEVPASSPTAAITVLLGLRTIGTAQQRLADIALALGAVITVLAAAEAFFSHRGLWILRTQTVRRLETLARHLDYQQTRSAGQPLEPAILDRYAAELDDILSEDYIRWQQLRATTPETRSPPETPGNAGQNARTG